jgi:hypothetical protein
MVEGGAMRPGYPHWETEDWMIHHCRSSKRDHQVTSKLEARSLEQPPIWGAAKEVGWRRTKTEIPRFIRWPWARCKRQGSRNNHQWTAHQINTQKTSVRVQWICRREGNDCKDRAVAEAECVGGRRISTRKERCGERGEETHQMWRGWSFI